MEALCRVDRVGSVAKPNSDISFFVVASVAVFSCQERCIVSDLICFARAMEVCFRFLALYRCCFRRLVLCFRNFFGLFDLCCFVGTLLGGLLRWFAVCLWSDLFFFKAPGPLLVGCRPLFGMPCFFAGRGWLLCAPAFCICLRGVHSGGPTCHTLCE